MGGGRRKVVRLGANLTTAVRAAQEKYGEVHACEKTVGDLVARGPEGRIAWRLVAPGLLRYFAAAQPPLEYRHSVVTGAYDRSAVLLMLLAPGRAAMARVCEGKVTHSKVEKTYAVRGAEKGGRTGQYQAFHDKDKGRKAKSEGAAVRRNLGSRWIQKLSELLWTWRRADEKGWHVDVVMKGGSYGIYRELVACAKPVFMYYPPKEKKQPDPRRRCRWGEVPGEFCEKPGSESMKLAVQWLIEGHIERAPSPRRRAERDAGEAGGTGGEGGEGTPPTGTEPNRGEGAPPPGSSSETRNNNG
mmetsp:Transcript_85719/g.195404  ORF Transcript_85719/g.195404 Transcript_85719/m.195404 type:complete len:301 (+) Transcript_85719:52-954(+)